ncbi:hypothetical protein MPTK1_2g09560 [Marchantia polymorpha subsp. ruderalis]|uniref:Uncharacterized protein n=1 Tax=Marchantia polymorpha TaxID=3197 RepID=A0A2R6W467_MARPO|nr:hypothetical protein MARPO_0158s0027 [Marchantia polymorpha]BBN01696.1 hypothetical protein Mp_2g09560 [Marchantia polymorpha subsp. ruderalis]|eukprot:PTQ28649.1 hypothetical protein MARPO_0158s0027 [Marchantia polymorpha]
MEGRIDFPSPSTTRGPPPHEATFKLSIVDRLRASLGRKRIVPISGSGFALLLALSPAPPPPTVVLGSMQHLPAADYDGSTSPCLEISPDVQRSTPSGSPPLDQYSSPSSSSSSHRPSLLESLRHSLALISATLALCVLHVVLGDWSLPSCVGGTI